MTGRFTEIKPARESTSPQPLCAASPTTPTSPTGPTTSWRFGAPRNASEISVQIPLQTTVNVPSVWYHASTTADLKESASAVTSTSPIPTAGLLASSVTTPCAGCKVVAVVVPALL